MKTFQDLAALRENEALRRKFVVDAVEAHKRSGAYQEAIAAEAYYAKHNLTIEKYQKFLYDAAGRSVPDLFSANYKLATLFFRRFVIQQTQYVLSNGITYKDEATGDKLGANFDNAVSDLAKKAMVGGVAFGFWNFDHLEVFSLADTPRSPGFVPLYDEDTSLLRAGIRYSNNGNSDRYTLYELDGITEYIRRKDEEVETLAKKRGYIEQRKETALGLEAVEYSNYPGFPVIPMYANDLHTSELVGIRPAIDCYDFIKSGMANMLDDTSGFYWLLKGEGGMDDVDVAHFINRMRQLKGAALDPGMDAEAHTLDVPVEAREKLLDRLRQDLYEDFMLLDIERALGGDITATGIRMAYQQQDDKCGDFEYHIRDFIARLFALLGINDSPKFKWNRIANQTEEINNIMTEWPLIGDDAALELLPNLTPEMVEQIKNTKVNTIDGRFGGQA